jgi:hypothetical protein
MRSIKILILCALAMVVAGNSQAQIVQPLSYKDYSAPYQFNIGGGVLKTTAPSAYLEIGQPSGSTKGLLLPRGSKDAIASPVMGLVIYDIPSSKVWWYTGSQWATAGTDTTTGGTTTTTITFQPPITLVGSTVKWTGTTTNVPEGVNLYWRQGRFDTAFAGKTTTNLTEGLNLYYTNARVQAFGDTRYVQVPRFLDSLAAIRTRYLQASDTMGIHNAIVALQASGGSLSTIKYVNGLYYKLSTNEVGAYYWQPIWNAKDLQGIHLKAIQPLHGMGIHYNANTNQWEPSYDSSFAGGGTGGIDLESLFWKADTADFVVTEDASGFVNVGSNVHLKPNPIVNQYYAAPYMYVVYQNGRIDSFAISGTDGLEVDPSIPHSADATTNKYLNWNGSAYLRKQILASEISGLATVATSGDYNDLTNKPTIADASINLTTTGVSGAASWNSGTRTLNIPQYSGGSGTVTAGTINWPGTLYNTPTTATVSGGTLTFAPSLATQAANKFFAGPTSGSAATSTWRNIVNADLPNDLVINGTITTNASTNNFGSNQTVSSLVLGTTGAASSFVNSYVGGYSVGGVAGTYIANNLQYTSGSWSSPNPTGASSMVSVGGTGSGIITFYTGTGTATASNARMQIFNNGIVGIGTSGTSPDAGSKLNVVGNLYVDGYIKNPNIPVLTATTSGIDSMVVWRSSDQKYYRAPLLASSVGSGGSADGNNYTTSVTHSFNTTTRNLTTTITRNGLSDVVSNSINIPAGSADTSNLIVQPVGTGTQTFFARNDTLFMKNIQGVTQNADSSLTVSGGSSATTIVRGLRKDTLKINGVAASLIPPPHFEEEDFSITSTNISNGFLRGTVTNANGGGAATIQDYIAGLVGWHRFQTGTTTNGSSTYTMSTPPTYWVTGATLHYHWYCDLALPTLSDPTNTYSVDIGTLVTGAATNGARFHYSSADATEWQAISTRSTPTATTTTTGSGVTVGATTLYRLDCDIYNNTATYYINGVQVAQHTGAQSPINGVQITYPMVKILKSAGTTNVQVNVDKIGYYYYNDNEPF